MWISSLSVARLTDKGFENKDQTRTRDANLICSETMKFCVHPEFEKSCGNY